MTDSNKLSSRGDRTGADEDNAALDKKTDDVRLTSLQTQDHGQQEELIRTLYEKLEAERETVRQQEEKIAALEGKLETDKGGRNTAGGGYALANRVDASETKRIQRGKNEEDTRQRFDVLCKGIEEEKARRMPSGVVLDDPQDPHIGLSGSRRYREPEEYRTDRSLGEGTFGHVALVTDATTGKQHAKKTVPKQYFSRNEVIAQYELRGCGFVPKLLLVQESGPFVSLHMEVVSDSVSLLELLNDHMYSLMDEHLLRQFCLCILHELLNIIHKMHEKNWAHTDLHGENALLTKDTVTLKVLDFGSAKQLMTEDGKFDHQALKSDVLEVIRRFCGLYINQEFKDIYTLESELKLLKSEKYIQAKQFVKAADSKNLSEERKEELLDLLKKLYDVVSSSREGYGVKTVVMRHIEELLFPGHTGEIVYLCFLEALREEKLEKIVQKLESPMNGQGCDKHHSPEAKIDVHWAYLLETLDKTFEIQQRLIRWKVLCNYNVNLDRPINEQFLQQLHSSVTAGEPKDYECLPVEVREYIEQQLERKMTEIKKTAGVIFFPDFYSTPPTDAEVNPQRAVGPDEPDQGIMGEEHNIDVSSLAICDPGTVPLPPPPPPPPPPPAALFAPSPAAFNRQAGVVHLRSHRRQEQAGDEDSRGSQSVQGNKP